jgi:hypothetical protein
MTPEKEAAIRVLAVDGYIEPRDVIARARNPSHILHDEFRWDLQEAAEHDWLETAKRLIRAVKIEVIVQEQRIRAVGYVSDPNRSPKSKRYVDITVAAQHRAMAQQVMLAEMERITASIKRAQAMADVLGLRHQLDALLENVLGVIDAAAAAARRTGRRARQPRTGGARKTKARGGRRKARQASRG